MDICNELPYLTIHQMCRFHLTYPTYGHGPFSEAESWYEDGYWDEDWYLGSCDEEWEFEERFLGTAVNDAEITEEDVTKRVELIKAIGMLSSKHQTHCEDCEPLFVDSLGSKEWCSCDIHSHFVKPWRCIPCVLAEETNLVLSQQKYTMTYDPKETRRRNWAYDRVNIALPVLVSSLRTTANWGTAGDALQMWQTHG
jgi:hypothetical protein